MRAEEGRHEQEELERKEEKAAAAG